MNCRKILEDNYKCMDGSFVYFLHDEARFDENSFWEYYDCLKHLHVEAQLSKEVNFTQRYILESFLYHLDPDDLCTIRDFPSKEYHLYLERIRYAVDAYFNQFSYDESIFDSELRKPEWVD